MAEITLAEARELCTSAELELVRASLGQSLASASEADLKKKVALARKQSDKWRGLYTTQRREVQRQQSARVNNRNQRTERKAQLFGEVLARFEAQLEKVAAGASRGDAAPNRQAKVTRNQRTQQHRETRARVRGELQEEVEARGAESHSRRVAKKKTAKKSTKKTTAKKPSKTSTAKKAAVRKLTRAVKKTTKKKTSGAGSKQNTGSIESNDSSLSKKKAKKAASAAKKTRVKVSGLDTRVRGHVSARGKRAQGRRDSQ